MSAAFVKNKRDKLFQFLLIVCTGVLKIKVFLFKTIIQTITGNELEGTNSS